MRTLALFALFTAVTACAVEGDAYEVEVPGLDYSELEKGGQPDVCPAIAILCAEGYVPKSLPNCRQMCVPDQEFECSTDLDCPQIACLVAPCDTYECVGHTCVL